MFGPPGFAAGLVGGGAVGAMLEALEGTGGKVIRRTLTEDAVQQLAASVATQPEAAPVIPRPKPPDAA